MRHVNTIDRRPSAGRLPSARIRWGRVALAAVVVVGVIAGGAVALVAALRSGPAITPLCSVAAPSGHFTLSLDQAANAATIAAVGEAQGLPDHAVTIAVATAMQESGLINLPGGDLDSVGLFQQRPSEGWGTPAQLVQPTFASAAFYRALEQVPNWQSLPVTEAAQAVQHSAAPAAYATWETEARAIAEAFTGETPGGLACQFSNSVAAASAASTPLAVAMDAELGSSALNASTAAGQWRIATWLVARAYQYHITGIAFGSWTWDHTKAAWVGGQSPRPQLEYRVAGVRQPLTTAHAS